MPRISTQWKLLGAGAMALLAIQLVPIDRTNPPVESDLPAPDAVKTILQRSCYDCHSHETRRPWYAYVAPASFLIEYDVREGRDKVNFSRWKKYRSKKRTKMLKRALKEIDRENMPPWYYLVLHPGARISDDDRATLGAWVTDGGS